VSRIIQWRTSVRHLYCFLAGSRAAFKAVFCLIENNFILIDVLTPLESSITWLLVSRLVVQMSIKTVGHWRKGISLTARVIV
jgi:hypothetical protein